MIDLKTYQPRPDLLKDRVILITGAGRGIGRVAALTFARHGATVILLGPGSLYKAPDPCCTFTGTTVSVASRNEIVG